MSELFEQLKPYIERSEALGSALTLFSWDNETLAPSAASENTSKLIGTLASEQYNVMINDTVSGLLKQLSSAQEQEKLTELEKAIVKKWKKVFDNMEKIPPEEYRANSELLARAGAIWADAKENNDFAAFAPTLKEIISYQKKFAEYTKKPGMSLYDTLLNEYEEGVLTPA